MMPRRNLNLSDIVEAMEAQYGPMKEPDLTPANESNIQRNEINTEPHVDDDGDIEMIVHTTENMDKINNYINNERTPTNSYTDQNNIQEIIDNNKSINSFLSKPQQVARRKPLVSKHAPLQEAEEPNINVSKLKPLPKLAVPIYLVVDTNVLLSNLKMLSNLALLGAKYHYTLIIPITVIHELDGLKVSKKAVSDSSALLVGHGTQITIGQLARHANNWIYKQFASSNPFVRGQKVDEAINKSLTKDDSIYDCCLYFKKKMNGMVILVSNDKNLCVKALKDDILTVTYVKGITSQFVAETIYKEAKGRHYSLERSVTQEDFELSSSPIPPSFDEVSISTLQNGSSASDNGQNNNSSGLVTSVLNNPYLSYSLEQLYEKLYLDIKMLCLSLFRKYLAIKSPTSNPHFIYNLELLISAVKLHWEDWSIDAMFLPNIGNFSELDHSVLTQCNSNSVILKQTSSGRQQFTFMYGDASRSWNISSSQEKFLYQKPTTLFQLKRFVDFWSTFSTKVLLVLNDDLEKESLGKLITFWTEVIEYQTDINVGY